MKTNLHLLSYSFLLFLFISCHKTENRQATEAKNTVTTLAEGRQPQLATDLKGVTRVVYGQGEAIYCATSTDSGETFSEPMLVGNVKGLYLGMSMGPQIASSANYSVITAIDKKGNIHSFSLQHDSGKWEKAAGVNDVDGSVPEGLMSIDADQHNTFYAVWLDVRSDKNNKIVFATTTGAATSWSDNRVVYESPDKTVCECCKPGIEVKGNQVLLMFRNWIDGNRDMYVTASTNGGQSFSNPQKLGKGTWKLEGCPMDGGGILLDSKNEIHTVWQREGKIFYSQPDSAEIQIGKGRNVRISGKSKPAIAWKDGSDIKLRFIGTDKDILIGKGSYIETAEMPDHKTLCVWENDGVIQVKKI